MTTYIKDFIYKLKIPFEYGNKGEMMFAKELLLRAPSNKQGRQVTKLQQLFMKAVKSMEPSDDKKKKEKEEKEEKEEEEEKITSDHYTMVMMIGSVDFTEVCELFGKLLCSSGICKIDGEIGMNEGWFENMCQVDTQALLGEYLENFLIPSAFSKTLKV